MGAWRLESTHVFKQILNKAVSHPWCVLKCQLSKLRQRIKQNRFVSLFLIKICIWIRVEQILHLMYIVHCTVQHLPGCQDSKLVTLKMQFCVSILSYFCTPYPPIYCIFQINMFLHVYYFVVFTVLNCKTFG